MARLLVGQVPCVGQIWENTWPKRQREAEPGQKSCPGVNDGKEICKCSELIMGTWVLELSELVYK